MKAVTGELYSDPSGVIDPAFAPNVVNVLLVLVHGNNGDAAAPENRYWGAWWEAAEERGWHVYAPKSPGHQWDVTFGLSVEDEADDLIARIRRHIKWVIGDPETVVYLVTFSNGTSVGSDIAFRMPECKGLAMLCAAGRLEQARLNTSVQNEDFPIFIGFGGRDKIVDPNNTKERIEEWKRLPYDVVDHELPFQFHTPHWKYIAPALLHLANA